MNCVLKRFDQASSVSRILAASAKIVPGSSPGLDIFFTQLKNYVSFSHQIKHSVAIGRTGDRQRESCMYEKVYIVQNTYEKQLKISNFICYVAGEEKKELLEISTLPVTYQIKVQE